MSGFVRLSTFFAWAFASMLCGAGVILCAFYLYLTPKLPDPISLKTTQLQTPLRIFSSDDKKLAEFGEKRRSPVNVEDVPVLLTSAFVAAEDNRFYEHAGIDIKGLTRAVAQLIQTGRIQSGGSTITMQVAKNFFLTREKTFIRKFNEIFLAIQIEQVLTKNEILELYLNKIYLGNRAYGVKAAAQVYYGRDITNLSLAEYAMIAGLPKAPSRYNPLANPDRAKIRRNWILDRMLDLDMITLDQHAQARSSELTAGYYGSKSDIDSPYIAEMARQKAIELFGSDAYTMGLNVYLTVDSKLQKKAQSSVRAGLEAYDKRHGYRGTLGNIEDLEALDEAAIRSTLRDYPTPHDHEIAVIELVEKEKLLILTSSLERAEIALKDIAWAMPYLTVDRVGPALEDLSTSFAPGDIIQVSRKTDASENVTWLLEQTPLAQGALVSIHPNDGAINALVGGYDFYLSKYNRATQAKRQPGSNFKAFIYLAALEENKSAATLINDAPIVFEDSNLETSWRPENSSGKFYGPTRLREALYNSRNLVSIRLLKSVGINTTLNHIKKFGFNPSDLPKDLSLALGSAAITPYEIATGYAMIANGGYFIEPYLVERIEDANGEVLYKANPLVVCERNCPDEENQTSEGVSVSKVEGIEAAAPDKEELINSSQPRIAPRIADERSVFIMHSMMKDVIKKGTGRRALALRRSDIAGKTGTTNDQKDAWFSGFNTENATSAWVGFDSPETLGRREYGSRAALPIWLDYMTEALAGTPASNMKQPPGIISIKIDAETGERANYKSQNTLFELFKIENAPEEFVNPTITPAASEAQNNIIRAEDIF
jgi:penicillin-binding protein 1A